MKTLIPHAFKTSRNGMALVMVISALALMAILMVAIFTTTQNEYKSTQAFVNARSAKDLADTATAIVEAQIQNGQYIDPKNNRTFHATQPGMVRVYNSDGSFNTAYKLYSSTTMKVTGNSESSALASEYVPTDWATNPNNQARYVDLNEPVVRPSLAAAAGGNSTGIDVYFPIIDPRAAWNYAGSQTPGPKDITTQVEGFTYSNSTPDNSATYVEVRQPANVGGPNELRLPMPVEWMYVLQDGTTGTLDATLNWITGNGGSTPTADNPIVGRVAFWTDDECCKININTASEPTFFQSPFYFHKRDYMWANCPPLIGEYQRYPGHPATVALSAVLAPNTHLDPLIPSLDSGFGGAIDIINFKNYIYQIAPKIISGGSQAGTLPFDTDAYSPPYQEMSVTGGSMAQFVDIATVKGERLFASVDEMLFKDGAFTGTATGSAQLAGAGRQPAFTNQYGGRNLYGHDILEKARFFLTAQSRAPEFTMYGLPRVAVWPLPDESLGAKSRTSFDQTIALCSTLRGTNAGATVANSYIFRRAKAHDQNYDLNGSPGLTRNQSLLNYLVTQMTALNWPQTSSLGNAPNFQQKYGTDNVNQLAVQFFDYIRCTNLYDSILAAQNDGSAAAGLSSTALYNKTDAISANPGSDYYTFTNQRITKPNNNPTSTSTNFDSATNQLASTDSDVLPGHGTVTPILWQNGTNKYQGFGRFLTLSEIGFTCICTADGYRDPNGVVTPPGADGNQQPPNAFVSGGVTALRTDVGGITATFPYKNAAAYAPVNSVLNLLPGDGQARWYSNFPPLSRDNLDHFNPQGLLNTKFQYGTNARIAGRHPITHKVINPLHPAYHPGFNPRFWNYTLAVDTPLEQTQKRVQLVLLMEAFCPMLGWTKMYPEFTIVIKPSSLSGITLTSQGMPDQHPFAGLNGVIKSNANVFQSGSGSVGTYPFGGHAGPSAVAANSIASPKFNPSNGILLPADGNWLPSTTSGHNNLNQYGLNSDFVTVDRTSPMNLTFSAPLIIEIYDSHNFTSKKPVQTLNISIPSSTIPVPHLAMNNCPAACGGLRDVVSATEIGYWESTDQYGRKVWHRAVQPPHWWCFNQKGCLWMMTGMAVNENYTYGKGDPWVGQVAEAPMDVIRQSTLGRLDQTTNGIGLNTSSPGSWVGPSLTPNEALSTTWTGCDVTRTMIPAAGDYRLMAALNNVPASMWEKHPAWTSGTNDPHFIHSWTDAYAGGEAGCILPPQLPQSLGGSNTNLQLVNGFRFGKPSNLSDISQTPDMPPSQTAANDANRYGDFDAGIAGARNGPYLNKPDEGNFRNGNSTIGNASVKYRSGYFFEPWRSTDDWRSGVYMSPNRMISSPVMFGSLPTGVWGGGPGQQQSSPIPGQPWQTLLFRPYSQSYAGTGGVSVAQGHPGDFNPRDHFLLDMFSMPVVEPYAISEPLSMAGRINLNFQIMPFTNIRRATALHALMKGEFITAIPNGEAYYSKTFNTLRQGSGPPNVNYWDEKNDQQFWHRPINVKETLIQFDEKFNGTAAGANHNITQVRGLFRSASQICEMHLIPDVSQGTSANENMTATLTGLTVQNRQDNMDRFWQTHSFTGENVRERPYSNLYNRITTRSNTFRVHVRAQMIKKARSSTPTVFDITKDAILSEYRGSTLIERYIDPNVKTNPLDPKDTTTAIPDYAQTGNPLGQAPLESFYRFRALESKRFNP